MGEVLGTPVRIRRFQINRADFAQVDADVVAPVCTIPPGEPVMVLGAVVVEAFDDTGLVDADLEVFIDGASAVSGQNFGNLDTGDPAENSPVVVTGTALQVGVTGVTLEDDGAAGSVVLFVAIPG